MKNKFWLKFNVVCGLVFVVCLASVVQSYAVSLLLQASVYSDISVCRRYE